MNKVTINPIVRKVDVQQILNKVDMKLVRIKTEYEFQWFSQATPEYKEV
jgi:hypothetical protein